MNKISTTVLLTVLAIGLISLSIDSIPVFAQASTAISMVPGSSAPTNKIFYDPSPANVKVGTTVTWTNNDATLQTIVSGTADSGPSGVYESPIMAKGATFQHTFDTARTLTTIVLCMHS